MVRKAARGELHLERTIWKLRTEKYGPYKPGAGNGLIN
jgi:hypothetical protein